MPKNPDFGVWAKPPSVVRAYSELLAPLRHERFALLELGIAQGDSLVMWRDGFPLATIVGVDIEIPDIEFGPRVHLARGDQADPEFLTRVRDGHAPDGFGVIIDDASHLGVPSARSLMALFPEHLRSGGLYVIEDWGTGYLPSGTWPSAAEIPDAIERLVKATCGGALDAFPTGADERDARMPSYDHGLVGLVKRIVDHIVDHIAVAHSPQVVRDRITPLPVESLTVTPGMAVLRKRRT